MSDAGGDVDATNVTLTFDGTDPDSLPNNGPLVSGTFKPTDFDSGVDVFPNLPAGPYGLALSVFNGISPTGTWRLYVQDDLLNDRGSLDGGWSLSITTRTCIFPPPPVTP